MITNVTILINAPENIGSPASFCATPTVKGLNTPLEKPQPTASRLIPSPVKTSHPKLTDKATTMGTIGTHSSNDPSNAPISMKNRQITAMNEYLVLPYAATILFIM